MSGNKKVKLTPSNKAGRAEISGKRSKCRNHSSGGRRSFSNKKLEVDSPVEESDCEETQVISDSDDNAVDDAENDDEDDDDDADDDDDVICLSSTQEQGNTRRLLQSSDLTKNTVKNNRSSRHNWTSFYSDMPAVDIISAVGSLKESLLKMKEDYETQLREKDEAIRLLKAEADLQCSRLKNELEWKTQQIEELNHVAERGVEVEARINYLLSDRKAYEEELRKISEKERNSDDDDVENKVSGDNRKKKKRRQQETGTGDTSDVDAENNEADDIEELLIGLKETPDDKLFSLGSVPLLNFEKKPETVVSSQTPLCEERVNVRTAPVDDSSLRKGRHKIRKLVSRLQEETKAAAIFEADRRERVKRERQKHEIVMETDEATGQQVCTRMVLAFRDEVQKIPWVEVDAGLLRQLKTHQVEAVEFMWDSLIESMERLKESEQEMTNQGDKGTGCILAHCMGLGKTLSVITLLQTLLSCDVGFKHCLIISPLNAVLNWVSEWEKWVKPEIRPLVFDLASPSSHKSRADVLCNWIKDGGILVVGYSLFRILVSYRGRSKRLKSIFAESLIDPGPDVIVCDEGHVLKNDSSAIAKCLNRVATKRRIVLTGTPLQNNLIEYHCMVNFVRPNLLGTRQEFSNRFVNPITNGQHSDSTSADVHLMKRRSHVLHNMLSGCIHRRDYSALMKFLPPKYEFVVSVRLSEPQINLYKKYLDLVRGSVITKKVTGAVFFSDYQNLMRIWSHPWILKMEQIRQDKKPLSFSDDDELESLIYTSSEEEEEEVEEKEGDEEEKREAEKDEIQMSEEEEEDLEEIEGAEEMSEEEEEEDLEEIEGDEEEEREAEEDEEVKMSEEEEEEDLEEGKEMAEEEIEKVVKEIATKKGKEKQQKQNQRNEEREEKMRENIEKLDVKDDQVEKMAREKTDGDECKREKKGTIEIKSKKNEGEETTTEEEFDDARSFSSTEGLFERTSIANSSVENEINGGNHFNGGMQCNLANPGLYVEKAVDENGIVMNKRKAKVFAGEVIRRWQTRSRSKGLVEEESYNDIDRPVETWWSSYLHDDDHFKISLSGKLVLLFEILRMAEDIGDKVLVFSQSLLSLDLIEDFLKLKTEEAIQCNPAIPSDSDVIVPCQRLWIKDEDYLRMDGSTGAFTRKRLVTNFSDPTNKRLRLFLISTKAGGLGINLDAANRVVIFDASWNPSHDIQSVFRVYRFGQMKAVYIYRFLAQGTMEEKIYDRQVTKETLSHRVLDEQQIDRHFTAADLSELYLFKPDHLDESTSQKTLPVSKDMVLNELLSKQRNLIVDYHEHDSLLERRPEEDLSEEERKSAWEEFEKEKQGICYPMLDSLVGTIGSHPPRNSSLFTASAQLPSCLQQTAFMPDNIAKKKKVPTATLR